MAVNPNTYWAHNGKHEGFSVELHKLIPISGPVKNPRKNVCLEKFRKAANCYYDLYNNGLCNRAREFARVFGIPSQRYGSYGHGYSELLYAEVEKKMDVIVMRAATEQGMY